MESIKEADLHFPECLDYKHVLSWLVALKNKVLLIPIWIKMSFFNSLGDNWYKKMCKNHCSWLPL